MYSPFVINLNPIEGAVLIHRTRGPKGAHREVVRARIILAAARGEPLARIATRLDLHVDKVRKWCERFAVEGIRGLKMLVCTPPAETDLPQSRLSISEIRTLAVSELLVQDISLDTISRWMTRDTIKPWQYRSWLLRRVLDFAPKTGRVLDLYAHSWEG